MKRNTVYTHPVHCPKCGAEMWTDTRRYRDGWHDVAECCGHVWDTCCALEFAHTTQAIPVTLRFATEGA
jgi:hypothetical protein